MRRRCEEHINSRSRDHRERGSSLLCASREAKLIAAQGAKETISGTEAELPFPRMGHVTPGKIWKNPVLPVILVFRAHRSPRAMRTITIERRRDGRASRRKERYMCEK